MKTKTGSIIAIVLLSLLACGLVFATYIGIKYINISDLPGISFSTTSQRLALDKEFEFKDTKVIDVETDGSDVQFIKGEDKSDTIKIKIYASEDKTVSAEKESDALNVSVKDSCKGFCFGLSNSRIEITLPEEYEGDFAIRTDAGDIKSDAFSKASFDINDNAGDIDIVAAKSIKVTSDAGDLDLGSIENITIKTNAGDIKINECFGELHLDTNAGDVEINELQLSKNSDIKTDAGDVKILNSGAIYTDAHADFGDVNIQNNSRKSDIELKIETHAGDIKVN